MNRNQKTVLWFGSMTLLALSIIIGMELDNAIYFVFAIIQFVVVLVLILGKSEQASNKLTAFVYILGVLWLVVSFFGISYLEDEGNYIHKSGNQRLRR